MQKRAKLQNLYQQALKSAQAGDFLKAEKEFSALIKLLPNHPETLNNLAFCLLQQQKSPDKIEALLKKAIRVKENHQDAYVNLIQFYKNTNQPINAHKIFNKFESHCKLSAQQRLEYARLLQDIGQFWESYDRLKVLIDENAGDMEVHFYFANVALRLGDNDNAKKHFQIVLDHEFNVVALNNLAMCYLSTSDKLTAEKMLRESIQKIPQYAEAYRNLSMLKKFKRIDDEDIVLFESALKSIQIRDGQKTHLHFALGKAYDDTGQYEKAFEQYQAGNQNQRKLVDYSINDPIEKLQSLKKCFSQDGKCVGVPELFDDNNPLPIFIVGMPRSGTSLVEQILSSVDSVNALGELTLVEGQMINNSISSDFDYPHDFHQLTRKDFQTFRNDFFKHINRINKFQIQNQQEPAFIIDKQPFNFWHLGLILQMFPEAKFIHVLRNPLDTCLSNYFQFFHGNLGYVYDLKEIGQYYQLHEEMMGYWNGCYPSSIFTLDYQQLVDLPETTLIPLFEFLGIEWSDQYLKFYNSKRAVRTLSVEQVRSPIYKGSVERWKNYQPWIGELIKMFS